MNCGLSKDIVYKVKSSEYDPIVRQGVRNKKIPSEILAYEGIKDKYEKLKDRQKTNPFVLPKNPRESAPHRDLRGTVLSASSGDTFV